MSKKTEEKVQIGGIKVDSTYFNQVLEEILKKTEKNQKISVFTPNPEFMVASFAYPWFKRALNKADFKVPDGVGLQMAAEYLKATREIKFPLILKAPVALFLGLKVGLLGIIKPNSFKVIPERITGVDLMTSLCQEAAKKRETVYFLGGLGSDVAEKALKTLKNQFPGLKGWAEYGPELNLDLKKGEWDKSSQEEITRLVRRINQKKPAFLFVGFSMAKQLKFISENLNKLNVKLAMGVGGAFDYSYLGGRFKRAPKRWQKSGLEWFWRLLQEPGRFQRILTAAVVFPLKIFLFSLRKTN